MAGKRALRAYLAILQALSSGPKSKAEIKRAAGYDVVCEYPALDSLLQDMRVAGVLECHGKTWALATGKEICQACQGRGLYDKETA